MPLSIPEGKWYTNGMKLRQKLLTQLTVSLTPGGTTTVPHGLYGHNGHGVVPHTVRPNQSSNIVVDSADDTNVAFSLPAAVEAETDVPFEVLAHHTIQARPDTPQALWKGSELFGRVQDYAYRSLIAPGADGSLIPTPYVLDVYVQSDSIMMPGLPAVFTTEHGDDANDGLTPATALRTLDGVYRAFRGCGDAYRIIVHLMGGGGEPVDSPTEGRWYWTRHLRLGGIPGEAGDCYQANFCYRGPRNGIPTGTTGLTLVSATDMLDGTGALQGRAKLEFSQPITVGIHAFLRHLRADGREAHFPFPGGEDLTGGDSGKLAMQGPASFWTDAPFHEVTDTYNGWYNAAILYSDDGDNQFRGIYVTGHVAGELGNRHSAGLPTFDINPWPSVERIGIFGRSVWEVTGDYNIDTCSFADGASFLAGRPRLRGAAIESHLNWQAQSPFRGADSSYNPNEDMGGRALEVTAPISTTRYTGVNNPDNPTCLNDFVIGRTAGAGLTVGGMGLSGKPGVLRIFASMQLLHGGAVIVRGKGSSLMFDDYATGIIRDAAGALGFWALDGGRIRFGDTDPTELGWGIKVTAETGAISGFIRVGKGAWISLADFRDAAKWNFYATRRLEAVVSSELIYPTDDDSVAWGIEWEPLGYRAALPYPYLP